MKELGDVRDVVAVAERPGRDTQERPDIGGKTVVGRAIAVDVRLCLRPGPIEQRQEPVMEHIEERTERRIGGVSLTLPRVFGDVQWQRAIRTEQPEQPHPQSRLPLSSSVVERGDRGGSKCEIGFLPQAHGLVNRPERLAPARLVESHALQPAQRLVEIEAVGRLRQLGEEPYSVALAPQCGIHRLISPRLCDRRTVSVNELIETWRAK